MNCVDVGRGKKKMLNCEQSLIEEWDIIQRLNISHFYIKEKRKEEKKVIKPQKTHERKVKNENQQ